MYDYTKLRTYDEKQINAIVQNPKFEFKQSVIKSTGEIENYPLIAKWLDWEIKVYSQTLLEITGSFHKFWNYGTNENDFTFYEAKKTIEDFCQIFGINPELFTVCNLEFGVNVNPSFPANDILEQVICYGNNRPLRAYECKPNFYFIEFRNSETYIKLYDKGVQYQIDNTLRFEIKAMKSRYLTFAGISTLNDLMCLECMQELGTRLYKEIKKVVFKDDTIDFSDLSKKDKKIYLFMKDSSEWIIYKGTKTPNQRHKERRFIEIVQKHGKRKLRKHLSELVLNKILHLTNERSFTVFTPNIYGESDLITSELPF